MICTSKAQDPSYIPYTYPEFEQQQWKKKWYLTDATSLLSVGFHAYSCQLSLSSSPFRSLGLQCFLSSETIHISLVYISFIWVSWGHFCYLQPNDSLSKMTARFRFFPESSFLKVEPGSMSVDLHIVGPPLPKELPPSCRIVFLQEPPEHIRLTLLLQFSIPVTNEYISLCSEVLKAWHSTLGLLWNLKHLYVNSQPNATFYVPYLKEMSDLK